MKKEDLRIGIALSGGGMRAAVYHLGVLKYLAQENLFSSIRHISSVSGASICVGLIYACNGYIWPSDKQFLKEVLDKVKYYISDVDIQWYALMKLLVSPYYWNKKVNLLGCVMEKRWGIRGGIQHINDDPLWDINTTAFENGKDFRISKQRMGKHGCAYVDHPHFRLSHAMAASAGFPVLIGPYKLKTKNYEWLEREGKVCIRPVDETIHLWDGGVYDNMGLDPLFHIAGAVHLQKDINYLIVSNASMGIGHKKRAGHFSIANLKRLLDISMSQVESIKARSVIDLFKANHNGVYIKIGYHCEEILKRAKIEEAEKKRLLKQALKQSDVDFVKGYKTTLEKVAPQDFDRILDHGYQSAQATMMAHAHLG